MSASVSQSCDVWYSDNLDDRMSFFVWMRDNHMRWWEKRCGVGEESKLTYSHRRTCDHRVGKAQLPFYQSKPHTPQSVCKKKRSSLWHENISINNETSEVGFGTLVLDWTCSLQMRHFLTRGEQREQVAIWPQGPKSVSLFISEHTMHSSRVSLLLFRDGLREPTCPLRTWEEEKELKHWLRYTVQMD